MRFGLSNEQCEVLVPAPVPMSQESVNIPLYSSITAALDEALSELQINQKYGGDNHLKAQEKVYEANYTLLQSTTSSYIQRQARTVEEIIRKEIEDERKRQQELCRQREEQERKQRELEEQRRKEEELRKKKEEEQKKKEEEQRKQEELRKRQEQEEQLKKEQQQKKEEAEKAALEAKKAKGFTNFKTIEERFFNYKKDIKDIKEKLAALDNDKESKKAAGQIKRKINPKFGQLNTSFEQLKKVAGEVVELINLSKTIQNPLVYEWILNFAAKAIVSQAETEVTVKSTAALPLARMAEVLLNTYPEFEYFLSARFVKKCPYIIGYTCSIDSEEGRTRMGWKRQDTRWEQENKYEERVAGICTVWTVLSRLTNHESKDFYSPASLWSFVARLLNTDDKLVSNPHFMIACNFWEAGASELLGLYGRQAQKLLVALLVAWPAKFAEKKFPGATALRLLGEEWRGTGNIKKIKEMENYNSNSYYG